MSLVRAKLGLSSEKGPPSALIYGADVTSFEAIRHYLQAITKEKARTRIYLCAPNDLTALKDAFPEQQVLPLPLNTEPFTTLFLSQHSIRAAITLGDAVLPGALHSALVKRASPIGKMRIYEATANAAPREGIIEDLGIVAAKKDADLLSSQTDQLLDMVGRERDWDARGDMKLRHFIGAKSQRLMNSPIWRERFEGMITRYDDTSALADALGAPKTILVLGNGPSSEDQGLEDLSYDALFRANHTWRDRPKFTKPDLVFTGLRAAMRALKEPIIGVSHEGVERMLLAQRALTPVSGRLKYFVHQHLAGIAPMPQSELHRPTSGAHLVSTAVGLKPERLVIAGIDMFQHKEGAYPGKSAHGNAYTPAHSYEHDLACILATLEGFDGELVVFGDVLRDILQQNALLS